MSDSRSHVEQFVSMLTNGETTEVEVAWPVHVYRRPDGATLTVRPDGSGVWESQGCHAGMSPDSVDWCLRPGHREQFGWVEED